MTISPMRPIRNPSQKPSAGRPLYLPMANPIRPKQMATPNK